MKISTLCILLTVIIFTACKKTTTSTPQQPALVNTDMASGFPSDASAINGYFYAGYNGNAGSGYLTAYCVFRDPAANIISTFNHYQDNELFTITSNNNSGNIRVGTVNFNDLSLFENNNSLRISYRNSTNTSPYSTGSTWRTDGNGTFKPVNLTVPKGFPNFTYPTTNYFASLSQGFSLDLPSLVTNFDSLVVFLGSSGFVGSNALRKATGGGATTLKFTKDDFQGLGVTQGSGISMYIYAYNYSNKTIENKVYVFEFSNKLNTYIVFTS